MLGLGLGRQLNRLIPGATRFIDRFVSSAPQYAVSSASVEEYWTDHNVTLHHEFKDAAESLDYLSWRNDQYIDYAKLMPVSDASGLAVLDFGCGPGHDLVGFGVYSNPARLIGVDVSKSSLDEAGRRLLLHGIPCELIHQSSTDAPLPLADGSIDLVHSSGVLHHTSNPAEALNEFYRVLKPGGRARIMIYHENSLWMNLYVAYQKMIVEGLYPGLTLHEAFEKTTDGPNCPIARCYTPEAFLALARQSGFESRFLGAAVSAFEMTLLPKRFDAIQSLRMPKASRLFLSDLEFTSRGLPTYNGVIAGVDACFELMRP